MTHDSRADDPLAEENMADESVASRLGGAPGSYVGSDAGINVPNERTDATSGETFEGMRDNEQLGRPRETMLREVQDMAPPATGTVLQNDQIGRQVVSSVLRGQTGPEPATPDAANTDGPDDISLGRPSGRRDDKTKEDHTAEDQTT